jgi:hypothetical protein
LQFEKQESKLQFEKQESILQIAKAREPSKYITENINKNIQARTTQVIYIFYY